MASTIGNNLLEAEDAQDLVHQGQLSPVLNGKRKISAASILTTSSHSSTSSQSASSISPSISSTDTVYEIPVSLRSKEAFEFLGLTSDTAARLWTNWINLPTDHKSPEGPIGFLDMATDLIDHQETDADSRSVDWEEIMCGWGVTEELISAVMASEHAGLRMTESAKVWTCDTMRLRWRALQEIRDVSRERLRKKHGVRAAGGEYHDKQEGAGLGLREGSEQETRKGERPSGKPLNKGMEYTLLWQAQDVKRLEGMIDAQGKYHLTRMYSMIPSDFRVIQGNVLSFSPQRRTAEMYARYAKCRSQCSGVKLVWMRVPNELIQRNKPVMLQYGDDWKKIVFASRRGDRFPKELKGLQNRQLFIGHICRNHNEAIAKLSSWREISIEDNVMLIDEPIWDPKHGEWNTETRRATQYVFNSDKILEELEEEATFRIMGVKDKSPVFSEETGEEI